MKAQQSAYRHRNTLRIQERRSARTGRVYYYGDFRSYADVGGRVEPLREIGARYATSDPATAARHYAERVAEYRARRVRAVDAETPAETAPLVERLGDMIALHLERKSQPRAGRRPSTVKRDRENLAVVRRILGNCRLDEVTPRRCDDFVLAREREAGVRPGTTVALRTIRNELNSLGNLFERAVAMGCARENPVRRMSEKPVVPLGEADYLGLAEAARLLDAAAELDAETHAAQRAADLRQRARRIGDARRNPEARAFRAEARRVVGGKLRHPNVGRQFAWLEVVVATMLYTGGRLSEVLGLLVADIDFISKRVWFRANAYRPLKRSHHRRDVELWAPLELLLHDYLARTGIREGLLFPGRTGGMIGGFAKQFTRCIRRAGLAEGRRITPHTLRHTYATRLLQTLVPLGEGRYAMRSSYEVAKRLGHRGSALVDEVYGHFTAHPEYRETLSYEEGRRRPANRVALLTAAQPRSESD